MASTPNPSAVAKLQAIAQYGSQGPAKVAAQTLPTATQQSAVDAASARAGLINAPQAFIQQSAAKVAEPFQTAATLNNAHDSALNGYLGSLNGGYNNYMNELKAAMPIVQANTNQATNSAGISQLMQLLNLENTLANSKTSAAAQAKTLADQATQQKALTGIVGGQDANSKGAQLVIQNATDLPSAMAYISGAGKSAIHKAGSDPAQVQRAITGYFDPETASQLQPIWAQQDAAAAQAASAPKAPSSPSGLDSVVGALKNAFQAKSIGSKL